MTHDPLCLCAEDESRCSDCWDDCACACFDIRRVRPVIVNAALSAAREAVVGTRKGEDFNDFWGDRVIFRSDAIAAIDALRRRK